MVMAVAATLLGTPDIGNKAARGGGMGGGRGDSQLNCLWRWTQVSVFNSSAVKGLDVYLGVFWLIL